MGFETPNYPALGSVGSGVQWTPSALCNTPAELSRLPVFQDGAVVTWRFTPGHSLTALERMLDAPTRAVILETYGAGSGPGNDPRLCKVIAHAHARGVLFAAVSQCPWGLIDPGLYASGRALADSGVIGGRDMTLEAAYAKLHVMLAWGDASEQFLADWCGEISPPGGL